MMPAVIVEMIGFRVLRFRVSGLGVSGFRV